jgi:hypoxanthine phosphoribosyltransferase
MSGVPTTRNEPGKALPHFAHPVEREFARLLDTHGIDWLYEPHTFILERDERGRIREAFTPDFYLPDLDLYVECTVMRQARTNRKRRKALRARQAGVPVEILYRRDFDRLARRWQLHRLRRVVPGCQSVV